MSSICKRSVPALLVVLAVLAFACSNEPTEVVTEVIKEVPVEVVKEVTKEVEVPIEVEKTVEVVREVTKEVEVPVEVEKVVEVERVVEVEKIVEVEREPEPVAMMPAGPPIYKMGLFEEPTTNNVWSNLGGGAGGGIWNAYVLNGYATSLFGYSDQRFEWIPVAAEDFPTPRAIESVNGTEFWTTEVKMREGMQWSDGEVLDANDFVFTVNTVLDLQLGSNWASAVDPAFVERVEALDDYRLKMYFKSTDEEGNPQQPGLSVWEFGLAFTAIMPEHYWGPIVEEAKTSSDIEEQRRTLFAHAADDAPTAGGFTFSRWEPGAFFENDADPNYFWKDSVFTQYENGAYSVSNPRTGETSAYFGVAEGNKTLEYAEGPHLETALFSIYGNQDAAVLALTNGDVDFLFHPLGVEKGFLDRLRADEDLEITTNDDNGTFYLGFNTRKAPMSHKGFRQAVATIIDKEFVAETILQNSAIPMYSMVSEGNAYWHNPDTPAIGKGLTRTERLEQAVELLKSAGFTYEEEPKMSEDGRFVEVRGKGLRMPDGSEVPPLTLYSPSAGYDPLRATFAVWIERWLNDLGIPLRTELVGFNVLVDHLFSETVAEDLDMWMLGWSFSLYPDYMESFFHTRHAPENEDGGLNWGGYSNAEFDEAAFSLLSETDLESAREKVFRLQVLLAEELPYVVLFTIPKIDAYRAHRIEYPYTTILDGLSGLQAQGMQTKALIK